MIQSDWALGTACTWYTTKANTGGGGGGGQKAFVAVAAAATAAADEEGRTVYIISPEDELVVQTVTLHAAPVTCMALIASHNCIISSDVAGIVVTFDESIGVYDKIYNKSPFALDSMEYGKRCATEREIQQETSIFSAAQTAGSSSNKRVPQRLSIQFIDMGGSYLLVPSMMGLKVLDWRRKRLLGVTGQDDAGSLRFISVCVAAGDAVINQQLQLARGALAMNSAARTTMRRRSKRQRLQTR